MNIKKIIVALLSIILCLGLLSACTGTETSSLASTPAAGVLEEEPTVIVPEAELVQQNNNQPVGYQLEKPTAGEEIAVITVKDFGEIKLRFFSDEAPKTVYNFKKHVQNGYYDNVIFHRVMRNFMIQGGDPDGTGTGGESIWEEGAFADEFNANLINIDGSVAMANSGMNTNGSQFFINNTEGKTTNWDYYQQMFDLYKQSPEDFAAQYGKTVDMDKVTEEYKALYDANGGNPHLDGYYSTDSSGHTVFAQVFEGMDIVNEISSIEVDPKTYKPVKDCIIEKIEIVKFEA